MLQINRSIMSHRRLLWFKWLMIFTPPIVAMVGHSLLGHPFSTSRLREDMSVAILLLVISYIFAETLFRVLGRLQAEALAREQDILTMNAVMQERERLSRELHDGVAQLVADLLLRLDTIKDLVETDRRLEAGTELERLHEVADEIYEDIGESIAGLRTNVTERGVIGALQDYIDQFEERHQIPTSLQTEETANRLSPRASLQIFRFIQEALTNVRKHAQASAVTVMLTCPEPGQLKIVITDNGQGFTPSSQENVKGPTLGMTSMRERIEALGGIFQVSSQPGSGTRITATIPIPEMRREFEHAALATPTR
jgi:two-component system, NarL family, sensor histidine kinase DegS